GQSGGGLVSVTLTGKSEMKSLKIDPSLFKEGGVERLEDLVLAAHNDAKAKVEAIMQEKTKALTAGLPIPPGMVLPFCPPTVTGLPPSRCSPSSFRPISTHVVHANPRAPDRAPDPASGPGARPRAALCAPRRPAPDPEEGTASVASG